MSRLTAVLVYAYAAAALCLWLAVEFLTDRAWPATLVAFGPRWMAALPLVPLLVLVVRKRSPMAWGPIVLISLTALVLAFGVMDIRLGLGRVVGTPVLRIMTHNLGEGEVTAAGLDRLMRAEHIDVAALQECPFYDYEPARLGWQFFYGGNLCLVSRYPFVVLDEPNPQDRWRRGGTEPDRYEVETPLGRFQLLNVHLSTIRGGLDALRVGGLAALPQLAGNREEAVRESRAARARIGQAEEPTVVAGDFNLPVESDVYRVAWGDLRNTFSSCGRGPGHTKFSSLFGIRIDHVLTSEHWRCADARVLASPYGGDHAPLVVDLVRVTRE